MDNSNHICLVWKFNFHTNCPTSIPRLWAELETVKGRRTCCEASLSAWSRKPFLLQYVSQGRHYPKQIILELILDSNTKSWIINRKMIQIDVKGNNSWSLIRGERRGFWASGTFLGLKLMLAHIPTIFIFYFFYH